MSQVYWQPGMKLEEVEAQVVRLAYNYFGRNKTKTAASLDIAIRTLDAKIAKYRLREDAVNVDEQEVSEQGF